jgi:hypothetical protein
MTVSNMDEIHNHLYVVCFMIWYHRLNGTSLMFMNSILDSIRMIPLYWCFPVVDHSFQFFLGGDLEKDMFDVTQNPNSKRLRSIGGEALRWKRESHGLRPRILPWNTQKKPPKTGLWRH